LPCVDLKDKSCIDECPVDCIYEGERMLYIHPDECVDCGACEPVCPVEAIYYEDDTPEEWADYYDANVEFFDDIGSPGGAAKLGLIPKDHPIVAALPPQEHDIYCLIFPNTPGGCLPPMNLRQVLMSMGWSTYRPVRPSIRHHSSSKPRCNRRPIGPAIPVQPALINCAKQSLIGISDAVVSLV